MATVLITGGTGMLGKALSKALLAKRYHLIILTRKKPAGTLNQESEIVYTEWDINKQTIDRDAIAKSDYIIHLAGASITEKRWTEKRKKEIENSRVMSSALLVMGLKEFPNNVKTVISASAIGLYGSDSLSKGEGRGKTFVETDPPAHDFLGQTCRLHQGQRNPGICL